MCLLQVWKDEIYRQCPWSLWSMWQVKLYNWQQKAHHGAAEEVKNKSYVFLLPWPDCGKKIKWTQEGNVTKWPVAPGLSVPVGSYSAKFIWLILQGTDKLVEIQSNSIWRDGLDSYPCSSIPLDVIWTEVSGFSTAG